METEIPQENENEDTVDADIDWDNRILCSDGNCIGVIGPDGRCKECGKRYEGPLPETIAVEKQDQVADDQAAEESEEMPAEEADIKAPGEFAADEGWENRVLCSDGNCIGIIGPDGKCKECGKPLE